MSTEPLNRIVSILLLLVFLFNVGGYYLVFLGLRHHSDALLSKKIEEDKVTDQDLLEIKIPVSLPYPVQQTGFERVDGKFEHRGTFYKLVKQKYEKDTLYVICLRDTTTKRIATAFKDYVSKTNDLPVSSKNTMTFLGKFLKDFEGTESNSIQHGTGWVSEITFEDPTFNLHNTPPTLHSPPPKA